METSSSIPRPLTEAERNRILRAHRRIPDAEAVVRRRYEERDRAITEAVTAGASPTEIAKAIGVGRQAVYDAVKRSTDR